MAKNSTQDAGVVIGGCLGILLLFVVVFLLGAIFWGWLIMLAVGALHGAFGWPETTIGMWWTAVGLGAIFSLFTSAFTSSKTRS